jgi:hypothetical protein
MPAQVKLLQEKLEAAEGKAVALEEARAAQAAAERDLQVLEGTSARRFPP